MKIGQDAFTPFYSNSVQTCFVRRLSALISGGNGVPRFIRTHGATKLSLHIP